MGTRTEGFLGSVIAVEGISDATTLLNEPDGCRMVMNDASSRYYPRPTERVERAVPFNRGSQKQKIVGKDRNSLCTPEKLAEAIAKTGEDNPSLIAVVNAADTNMGREECLKAAEDSGYMDRTVVLDSDLASVPLNEGMDQATVRILRKLIPGRTDRIRGRINVLGVNILTKDWLKVEEEFTRIFGLMGLEVGCFLGAGCTVSQMAGSASAELNVVLCPEYVRATCAYYRDELGVPSVELPCSAVGFDSTEEIIRLTAEATGADPSRALEYVDEFRRRAFGLMDNMRLRLRGKTFDLEAEPSLVLSLLRILLEDLDLTPQRVAFNGTSNDQAKRMVEEYLEAHDLSEVLTKENSVFPDYMLADGNKAWIYETTGRCGRAIDLGYPSENCHCFRDSAVLGPSGMMYLLDRIMMPKGY